MIVDDEAEGEEDGAEWAEGIESGRVRGRRVVQTADVDLPDEPGWQWEMPLGLKVGQCVASLHLGPRGEPSWYDAIVIDTRERRYNHGASAKLYHVYFPEDEHDDWYTLPDDTVAYRVASGIALRQRSFAPPSRRACDHGNYVVRVVVLSYS